MVALWQVSLIRSLCDPLLDSEWHSLVSVSDSPSYWHLPPHPPGHRHLLGGKFRGQIMLSPETFTWDRWLLYSLFTLYTPSLHSAHRSSPESVLILRSLIMFLHNLFSVSGSTQFSCSRGRIMWKWGKCSQSRDITAFGIHPTSNLNMLQLNNNTLDIVLFRLSTVLTDLHTCLIFLFPFLVPWQMMVDGNLSVMNIPKQLQHQEIPKMLILYYEKAPQPFNQSLLKVSKYYRTCWNFTQILYRLWNLLQNLIATLKSLCW